MIFKTEAQIMQNHTGNFTLSLDIPLDALIHIMQTRTTTCALKDNEGPDCEGCQDRTSCSAHLARDEDGCPSPKKLPEIIQRDGWIQPIAYPPIDTLETDDEEYLGKMPTKMPRP